MKFFEFHFNPRQRKRDSLFDTFCFVPETKDEQRLGYLYCIGELKNILPKNKKFLERIAEIVKKPYYKPSKALPEESFKAALQTANEFLAQEIKKNNTAWLGNLNFAVLSLTPDFSIRLSKVGNLKILIIKNGEVFDIGKNVNFPPSPTKIFSNAIVGTVEKGDKILALTEDVFKFLHQNKIFQGLTENQKIKTVKRIFKKKKKALREISGVCFLMLVTKERRKIFLTLPKISLPSSILKLFQRILPQSPSLQAKLKKTLIALLILSVLLPLGYLLFR